jgi:hypothetical protein
MGARQTTGRDLVLFEAVKITGIYKTGKFFNGKTGRAFLHKHP